MKNKNSFLNLIVGVLFALAIVFVLIPKQKSVTTIPQAETAQTVTPSEQEEQKTINYACSSSKKLSTVFTDPEMKGLKVILDSKKEYDLKQGMSASGTRYVNSDETVVFWSKGSNATLSENNVDTYRDCVED